MKIYLVRHGMPVGADKGRRYLGLTDEPLCTEGKMQADNAGRMLSQLEPAGHIRLVSSTLTRSIQTAQIINEHLGCDFIETDDELREIDLGKWDGRYTEDIEREFPEEYAARGADLWNHRTPGGETFAETGARFRDALYEIVKWCGDDEAIVIVSHAGAINAGLSLMTDLTFEEARALKIPYAGIIAVHGTADDAGGLRLKVDNTYF